MELNRTQFSLPEAVGQVMKELSAPAAQKNIEMKNLLPEIEIIVNADHDKILQLLRTLVNRSISSVPANSRISIQVTEASGEITVQIQDSGPVLESGQIARIFNRADWIKEQFNRQQEALALGLPIAKELVQMHGGRIWAKCAEGQGNNFCFTIPRSGMRQEAVPINLLPKVKGNSKF